MPRYTRDLLKAKAKAFLGRFKEAEDAVAELLGEQYKYRDKLRDLRASRGSKEVDEADSRRISELERENETLERQIDELSDKIPAKDAVILTGKDAEAWKSFTDLKLDPAKLSEIVKENGSLKEKVQSHDFDKLVADAAADINGEGVRFNAEALAKVLRAEGLHLELRDVSIKGKDGKSETKKVPHVRKASEKDAQLKPLHEVAEADLKAWLPSLTAVDGKPNGTQQGNNNGGNSGGTRFPAQPASGGRAPSQSTAATVIDRTYNGVRPSQRNQPPASKGAS